MLSWCGRGCGFQALNSYSYFLELVSQLKCEINIQSTTSRIHMWLTSSGLKTTGSPRFLQTNIIFLLNCNFWQKNICEHLSGFYFDSKTFPFGPTMHSKSHDGLVHKKNVNPLLTHWSYVFLALINPLTWWCYIQLFWIWLFWFSFCRIISNPC